MMIPATPGSELKNIIENKAKSSNLKIKIVEKTGPKLGTYLKKFDKIQQKLLENVEFPALYTKLAARNAKKKKSKQIITEKQVSMGILEACNTNKNIDLKTKILRKNQH